MSDARGPQPQGAPENSAGIAMLRQVEIVDADLRVLLSGSARDDLVESTGSTLAPDVAAEVATLIRTHDFARRPIATGLAASDIALRVVRAVGPAGVFYTVFSERTLLRRRLAQVAYRFALDSSQAALLRLVAGGYPFAEMARRTGLGTASLRSQLRDLQEKAGCLDRKALANLVFASPPAQRAAGCYVNSPSPTSSPDEDSNRYRARRGDNRRR